MAREEVCSPELKNALQGTLAVISRPVLFPYSIFSTAMDVNTLGVQLPLALPIRNCLVFNPPGCLSN